MDECHWGPLEDPDCKAESEEYMDEDSSSYNEECECYANLEDDEQLCEESQATRTISGCLNQMNYDGSYRCHWGPGDIASCADEGEDYLEENHENHENHTTNNGECECFANEGEFERLCE